MRLFILMMFFLFLVGSRTQAQENLPLPAHESVEPLSSSEKELWRVRLEKKLNMVQTLAADFEQSGGADVLRGQITLARPNRLRLAYMPPPRWFFIGTGEQFVYYDADLKQVTYISEEDVPVAFLLQPSISLEQKDLKFTFYEGNDDLYVLTSRPGKAACTFSFDKKNLELRGWYFFDQNGLLVTVRLSNIVLNKKVNNDLFKFTDPNRPK
jgi:outer membrane lipoprotein-sorting protein